MGQIVINRKLYYHPCYPDGGSTAPDNYTTEVEISPTRWHRPPESRHVKEADTYQILLGAVEGTPGIEHLEVAFDSLFVPCLVEAVALGGDVGEKLLGRELIINGAPQG